MTKTGQSIKAETGQSGEDLYIYKNQPVYPKLKLASFLVTIWPSIQG